MIRSAAAAIILLTFSVLAAYAQAGQKAEVLAVSSKVVRALRDRDMNTLAANVHPVKGVRFSPFSEIQNSDKKFTAAQARNLMRNKTVYTWGLYDESERPIKGTFAKYYRQFVYDYNFARPDKINYNTHRNVGIMINNIKKMYPRGVEVEYFFEGTDDKMYGCLRLVYEKLGRRWYLAGVVRDTPGI